MARLFQAPDLAGDSLQSARLTPDGRRVTYLKGAADDKDRLDLWAYDVGTKRHARLVDALKLQPEGERVSAEEAARRERQRTAAFRGIVDYAVSPDGRQVLIPLNGDLYLQSLDTPGAAPLRLTSTPAAETDSRFSPRGRYVSYVRDGNLFALELATRREIALTRGATATVTFGTAEFIAQEEMDRDTGYWWAGDESRIAYTRVDESNVPVTRRFEINASDIGIVEQRYPFTGGANAKVALFVAPVATPDAAVAVDLGPDEDIYLARVQFQPGDRTLAVQRQSRDQKRLDLLSVDVASGVGRTLLTERSDTWVPLHDELRFLRDGRFVWASDASGRRQLSLHAADGRTIRALTRGDAMVVGDGRGAALKAIDERGGWFWFVANAPDSIGRQLFRDRLDAPGSPRQITDGAGWHSIAMTDDGRHFLDTWSSSESPPRLTLRDRDGKLVEELVANRLVAGHPYFPYAAAHVPAQYGQIEAADGQKLNYQLLKPPGLAPGQRAPVIVSVYGGPGNQNVRNAWGGSWAMLNQLLAQRGYVVFTLDNRGSGFRGRPFETALYHRLGTVEVEDQVRGVDFLRTLPYVDGERIGIYGWSYGGYLSLMCLLKAPQAFSAGVAGAPVTDWRLYDTHYTERYLGKPQDERAAYDEGNVLKFAASLSRPLLLMHGMADDNVLFTHSTQLMKVLQDARRPFELMTYPGGKHGLLRGADAGPHALQTLIDFFSRSLPVRGTSSSTTTREH